MEKFVFLPSENFAFKFFFWKISLVFIWCRDIQVLALTAVILWKKLASRRSYIPAFNSVFNETIAGFVFSRCRGAQSKCWEVQLRAFKSKFDIEGKGKSDRENFVYTRGLCGYPINQVYSKYSWAGSLDVSVYPHYFSYSKQTPTCR